MVVGFILLISCSSHDQCVGVQVTNEDFSASIMSLTEPPRTADIRMVASASHTHMHACTRVPTCHAQVHQRISAFRWHVDDCLSTQQVLPMPTPTMIVLTMSTALSSDDGRHSWTASSSCCSQHPPWGSRQAEWQPRPMRALTAWVSAWNGWRAFWRCAGSCGGISACV